MSQAYPRPEGFPSQEMHRARTGLCLDDKQEQRSEGQRDKGVSMIFIKIIPELEWNFRRMNFFFFRLQQLE
uniref:Uncharacterized protein n=1 Tax=Oryza sativa subsp. japonica TaxID=39947 RepID=Q8H2Z0_ORYSJ|nr:hypothetical protein [Oryza sativa Japonica Group]BAD31226.1 hypothetical protein [Oryza sativa Japonica Group]